MSNHNTPARRLASLLSSGFIILLLINPAHATQCLDLPDQNVGFGQVDKSSWADWSGLGNPAFLKNPQYLAVETDSYGNPNLRQKMVPSSDGTPTVTSRSEVTPGRTYRLTQSVYFEPGFDWGGRKEGGKFGFGFGGGSAPSGGKKQDDGFTARFMWRGNGDGSARIAVYSYASDRSQNLPYGDDYPLGGFDIPVGEWITLTMEVQMNSDWSVADGSVKAWVGDSLKLSRNNILWQAEPYEAGTQDQPMTDFLTYATFYGGSSSDWSPSSTTYLRFANVCWTAVDGSTTVADTDTDTENANDPQPSSNPTSDEPADSPATISSTDTSMLQQRLLSASERVLESIPENKNSGSWRLGYARDRLEDARDTSQWVNTDRLSASGNAMYSIEQAIKKLISARDSGDLNASTNIEIEAIEHELANIMDTLALHEVLAAGQKLAEHDCFADDLTEPSQKHCSGALRAAKKADKEMQLLIQAEGDPLEIADHADRAWSQAIAVQEVLD